MQRSKGMGISNYKIWPIEKTQEGQMDVELVR
jgi:hypothetical protein